VNTPITCTPDICETNPTCNPATGCEFTPITPCCGNGIVEDGESCDPPGSPTPDGGTCSFNCGFCGDGVLGEGEECEINIPCIAHDKPCKETVCDDCKCKKVPFPNGTIVPIPSNDCLDFVCQNGMAIPQPRPAGTACGNSVAEGVCDSPDTCDGEGHCNRNLSSGDVICRPAVNVCDVPERCTGVNIDCPANRFAPGGTLAPDDGNECTYDVCNGQGGIIHPFKARGTPCGNPKEGICDLPDTCDGAGVCDMNLVTFGNECQALRMAKVAECIRGPNMPYPHPSCFTVDMDQDGDVDLADCGDDQ
jgi:hypothetical protein